MPLPNARRLPFSAFFSAKTSGTRRKNKAAATVFDHFSERLFHFQKPIPKAGLFSPNFLIKKRPLEMLEILFEDEFFVAINKPPALLVHRTGMSEDRVFAVQMLRDQIGGQRVFPAHRLDRATSGVLVFGKNSEAASRLGHVFMQKEVEKRYLAIVRGFLPDGEQRIDEALADPETGVFEAQEARTRYQVLQKKEQAWAIGNRHATARFSLAEVFLETGRRHQIRKHFAHQRHPVINCLKHGDNKHNRFFKAEFGLFRMLLHAQKLVFEHPFSGEILKIEAGLDAEFERALKLIFE